jgi:CBS domain-containing membrane protein
MITVKELMTETVYTLRPNDTVFDARRLMIEKRIRHIPVVDIHHKFIGLITKHDLLALSVSTLSDIDPIERDEIESTILISEVMKTNIVFAELDTDLLTAGRFLLDQEHGCLPVFEGEKLCGMLTENDFVRLAVYLLQKTETTEQTTQRLKKETQYNSN